MKTVENIRLKVAYTVDVDGKTVNRSKSVNSLDVNADDTKLLNVGNALSSLMKGDNKAIFRIEEAKLS